VVKSNRASTTPQSRYARDAQSWAMHSLMGALGLALALCSCQAGATEEDDEWWRHAQPAGFAGSAIDGDTVLEITGATARGHIGLVYLRLRGCAWEDWQNDSGGCSVALVSAAGNAIGRLAVDVERGCVRLEVADGKPDTGRMSLTNSNVATITYDGQVPQLVAHNKVNTTAWLSWEQVIQ
jgi:hypothetical protein